MHFKGRTEVRDQPPRSECRPYSQMQHMLIASFIHFFSNFRKWRRVLPTTSSSSSAIPAASLEAFTPWTLTPRSLCDWLGWAHGRLAPLRWSPSTNTAQTGSSLVPSPLKRWAWAWMPSPSPAISGKEEEEQEEEEAGEQVLLRRLSLPSEIQYTQWHMDEENTLNTL